jgi:molybdopterin/thiamine biosynthesis adenylyltransferase
VNSIKDPEYNRNYGFWNEAEQQCINNAKVAIAGAGGDGFQLGIKLAMMGVNKFSIADPEVFERENSNRVFGAKNGTYGRNKAEVFRDMVHDVRPDALVEVYTDGVNEDNVGDFISGANLVLDESELTHLELGTMIARAARREGIPDLFVMNVGFAAIATSFHPTHGKTFEDIMGIPKNTALDEVADMKVDFSRCLPYIPKYVDVTTLQAVQEDEDAPLPSISQGVDVASAIGSTEAFLHLTSSVNNKRRSPTWAPKFRYMDAYNGASGIIRTPRLSYCLGVAAMAGRSLLGMNPLASYRKEERELRELR